MVFKAKVRKSNLPSETTMYSIHPVNGLVVVHHLPWSRDSHQLQRYIDRGFTFERPDAVSTPVDENVLPDEALMEALDIPNPLVCTTCGKLCKSKFGLMSHLRSHKEV